MTLPEGREPLLWRDLEFAEARGHPSTWEIECKQLRAQNTELAMQLLAADSQAEEAYQAQLSAESLASWNEIRAQQAIDEAKALRERVAELEAALTRIKNYTGHPSANTQTDKNVFAWADAALKGGKP